MSAWVWVAVALVGGLGSCARFALDGAITRRSGLRFPLGTFAVNVSGAFVLGLLTGLAVSGAALVIAGTATIGSFTTFSTWMFETHRLTEDGEWLGAVANVLVSLLVGFAAAVLGRTIGVNV